MRRFAILLASLTLAGCASAPMISTDSAPGTDFSHYRTYIWGAMPDAANPLANQRIVADINAQLQAKGWTESNDSNADVTLVAHVAKTQQATLDTFYTGGAYAGWGWRRFGGLGMGTAETTVNTYDVGTLVLDMFDTKTRQAIWRGTASGTVPGSVKSANAAVDAAIAKMFEGFPPGSP